MKWMSCVLMTVLGLTSFASCNSKPREETISGQALKKVEAVAKAELWTCAMHTQVHKDKPGQCPICGMTLVKIESEPETAATQSKMPDDHASFNPSAQKQEMIGVKTGIVEKRPLFKQIRASGRLAFDPDLYTAQNEYIEALKQMERVKDSSISDVKHSAERMVQSAKLRLKILGLSDRQISGLVGQESSDTNLLLNKPGQQVWVYADIYEMDLLYIQPGIAAEVTAGFLGGQTLPGKVVSVDRVINTASRTAKARILVQEAKTLLRPESYVDVTILAPMGEQVTVPFDAVFDTGKQAWVFVSNSQGNIEPRRVTIKFRAGDDVAIEQGLQGGESIVTSANFLIDSESRLRAVTAQSKSSGKNAASSCPKGKHFDPQMAMCMND